MTALLIKNKYTNLTTVVNTFCIVQFLTYSFMSVI